MTQDADDISEAIAMSPELIKAHKDTLAVITAMSPPHLTEEGPLAIAVSTVEMDNENLIFGREGLPECTNGKECAAHLIHGEPNKPLSVYNGPGAHGGLCLLCMRMECAMLVQMHRMCGSRPVTALLPPFCNLVDVPGGYKRSAMAVTPQDQNIIKGGVHIMGVNASLCKTYNPLTKQFFVDQGSAVFQHNEADDM